MNIKPVSREEIIEKLAQMYPQWYIDFATTNSLKDHARKRCSLEEMKRRTLDEYWSFCTATYAALAEKNEKESESED